MNAKLNICTTLLRPLLATSSPYAAEEAVSLPPATSSLRKRRSVTFIRTSLLSLMSFTAALLIFQASAAEAQCTPGPQFNRAIKAVNFTRDTTGSPVAQVQVALNLRDTTTSAQNLSFDVALYVNGVLRTVIPQDVVKHSAIGCAVTCAGKCPSIFGDGVCSGCGCNYNNWFTWAFGDGQAGDQVEAVLIPARGGRAEVYKNDDRRGAVFKGF